MATAAASIQAVPPSHNPERGTESPSSHQCRNRSEGTPKQTIPAKPSIKPNQPTGLIASANRLRANKATISGWESIKTEPKPAPVSWSPLARQN